MKPGAQYYITLIRDDTDSNVIIRVLMDPSKTFICPEEARKVIKHENVIGGIVLVIIFFLTAKMKIPASSRGVCFG